MSEAEIWNVYRHNLEVMMIADPGAIDESTLEMQRHNVQRDRLKRRRIARGDAMIELQKNWTCPVHAIWGELDALYLGKIHQIKGRLSNCDLRSFDVIPSAGHWAQYEAAIEFNRCVKKILNTN